MFEKVNRSGLIIYLYYNRDAKKLQEYGGLLSPGFQCYIQGYYY